MTREVEWDDDSREDMLALAQYEAGICACGFHTSLTHDRANYFTWAEDVCPVCAGAAVHMRQQAANDDKIIEAMGTDPSPLLPRPDDGRHIYTKLMTDAEVATAKQTSQRPRTA